MSVSRVPLLLSVLALLLGGAALVVTLTRDRGDNGGIVRVVRAVSDEHADPAVVKEQIVYCPDGYLPIGGGGNVPHGNDTPGVAIYWSAPFSNGWRVEAQDAFRRNKPWVLSAIVVCARGRDTEAGGQSLPPEVSGP
jgi:hypothetical protein